MAHEIEGQLNASGHRYGIVVGRFNSFITERLVEGALDCLKRHGADDDKLTIVRVPGAYEIPMAVAKMARSSKFDAIVALGCLIRGATPHFDYIASEATKGCANVSIETGVTVSFGILTTDTIEQAIERAGTKAGNKGAEAASAAIEMVNVLRELDK